MLIAYSIMVVVLAAVLAAASCAFAQRRHCRAGWYMAFLSCIAAGFIGAVLLFQADVFHLESWQDNGKGSPVRRCFLIGSGVALLPAFLVVYFYRERFRRHAHTTA